jgi:esterase/lipase
LYAIKLLKGNKHVDTKRIFLLGHSLGGKLAPRIAKKAKSLAGIIILAGSTRSTAELIIEQVTYIVQIDGKITPKEKEQIEKARRFKKQITSKKLRPQDTVSVLGAKTPGSYWLDLRNYNAELTASQLKIPIFIAQGKRDYQVTLEDYENCEGKSYPDEYFKSNHASEDLIKDIVLWLKSK